jgi:hypothetical protein
LKALLMTMAQAGVEVPDRIDASAPLSDAQRMMQRETRVTFGQAPHSLSDEPLRPTSWQMDGEAFLLRGEGDHYFYYRKGHGITIERGPDVDLSEESLWLNGSLYSAIASINGLVPIHASAVAVDGRVFAFTGCGGAGKSTLAAALGLHGLPMFCDDTLVLDLSDPDQIICLPGHKRLKLRPDALALTRAKAEEKVSQTVDKYYAVPSGGSVTSRMPLAELIFLEDGDRIAFEPVSGGQRLAMLQDDHYTAGLLAAARRPDRRQQFEHLARLASQVAMSRFIRPRDTRYFSQGVSIAAAHVTGPRVEDQ